MSVKVQGRLIARERLVTETNQKVTFYSIHTVKGWANVNFTEDVNKKVLVTPCLVEATVVSARERTNTGEDGIMYTNKSFLVNECHVIETSPAFEAFEQKLLEEKVFGDQVSGD